METITIECPHCEQTHNYYLQVERTMIMKMMTLNDFNEREKPYPVTRIFSCPVKEKKFEARIILFYTSSNKIESVGQPKIK